MPQILAHLTGLAGAIGCNWRSYASAKVTIFLGPVCIVLRHLRHTQSHGLLNFKIPSYGTICSPDLAPFAALLRFIGVVLQPLEMLTTLPRPSASDDGAAFASGCHGVQSTLEALELATLPSRSARGVRPAELASELGEKLLQRTVASVHASVFDEWLGSPPEAQARELGQFLASAGRNGHVTKGWRPSLFNTASPKRPLHRSG